ncbi:MAG: biotin/lipoyl-binding protein [Bacteroidales bacterium]|nr:biotin/lipoyl-binding protein [Bacteroidales bacterium]
MKNYKFTIRGNIYDVDILSFEDNIAEIEVNGTNYTVEVHKEVKTTKTPKLVRASVPEPTRSESKIKKNISTSATPVKAPLPGSILQIFVKEGDEVKIGDKLLIMEAMKMENNVLAEKSGKVTSLKVKTGDTVLQNDVLLEIQ